jgi:deoxyhypusine synthase
MLPDAIVAYVDSTIALPLLTSYALERHRPRKLKRLYDRREEMVDAMTKKFHRRTAATLPG